jgi:hypothetical protein
VDGLRDQLLARAGFALHQHRTLGCGHSHHLRLDGPHAFAAAEEILVALEEQDALSIRRFSPAGRERLRKHFLKHQPEALDAARFPDDLGGAGSNHFDGRRHVDLADERDDRDVARVAPEMSQQLPTRDVDGVDVQDDEGREGRVKALEPFAPACRDDRLEAGLD